MLTLDRVNVAPDYERTTASVFRPNSKHVSGRKCEAWLINPPTGIVRSSDPVIPFNLFAGLIHRLCLRLEVVPAYIYMVPVS